MDRYSREKQVALRSTLKVLIPKQDGFLKQCAQYAAVVRHMEFVISNTHRGVLFLRAFAVSSLKLLGVQTSSQARLIISLGIVSPRG